MRNPNYEPRPGLYRHFKGELYKVVSVGTSADTDERVVIYRSLDTGECWTRRVAHWNQPTDAGEERFVKVRD